MKWRPVLNALKIQTELLFFVIVTVAILAQGAHWAVAVLQAFFCFFVSPLIMCILLISQGLIAQLARAYGQ